MSSPTSGRSFEKSRWDARSISASRASTVVTCAILNCVSRAASLFPTSTEPASLSSSAARRSSRSPVRFFSEDASGSSYRNAWMSSRMALSNSIRLRSTAQGDPASRGFSRCAEGALRGVGGEGLRGSGGISSRSILAGTSAAPPPADACPPFESAARSLVMMATAPNTAPPRTSTEVIRRHISLLSNRNYSGVRAGYEAGWNHRTAFEDGTQSIDHRQAVLADRGDIGPGPAELLGAVLAAERP